ncbi:MAG: translation initiation factor IF-2 [Pseudomonadota bacterium]|nr:translation initiation factor IF-2 [Pseudomonadota bacterium]
MPNRAPPVAAVQPETQAAAPAPVESEAAAPEALAPAASAQDFVAAPAHEPSPPEHTASEGTGASSEAPAVSAPAVSAPAASSQGAEPGVAAEPAPVEHAAAVEAPVEVAPPAPPPRAEPTLERAVIIDRPGGYGRLPSMAPAGVRAAPARLNDTPILPGLGRAVVSLPAGYDPTDPTGARRRAREQASQTARWGPGADRRPGAPGPGRVDAGAPAPASDDRRPKKGPNARRSEHVPMPDSRSRKPKGRGGKDMRSVRPVQTVKHRVRIEGEITVANLAHEMGVKAAELIKLLMSMGQPATVNQTIDFDTASLLAQELGHEVVNIAFDEAEHLYDVEAEGSDLPNRAPVVTIMGHVDHGKTTLLDTIRKAKVAAGEAGGITQHIGAYTVKRGDRPITFIDTPGHAAFSAMRARGAKATDIIVLVVAADDGVMPQTVEAISHAKAAGVPILVAVNKMDKPGVQPERVTRQLMEHGLVSEEYGGDVIFVPVSALKGTGVNDLLDNILVVAEVADLRANPDRHAEGVVLESRLEVGRGAVASLLVQTGTLKQGDTIVIGSTWGRVRAMSDDRGQKLKEAGPSTPVEIFGLQDVPNAGDEFAVVETEKDARALVDHRSALKSAGAHSQRAKMTLEDLYKNGGVAPEVMKIVLKADVSGSLEALKGALEGLVVSGTQLKILHAAIGPVNESDVNLAAPDQALIIAFDVKSDTKARQAADQYGVEIKKFEIIYNVLDEVKARMQGLLAPIYEEQKVGEAEVRALFKIPKLGFIAGCMVMDGKVNRGAAAKVFRAGKQIAEGKVTSLKRFKEDVREVEKGFECGIGVEGATDIQEGDKIALYTRVQVARPE